MASILFGPFHPHKQMVIMLAIRAFICLLSTFFNQYCTFASIFD